MMQSSQKPFGSIRSDAAYRRILALKHFVDPNVPTTVQLLGALGAFLRFATERK